METPPVINYKIYNKDDTFEEMRQVACFAGLRYVKDKSKVSHVLYSPELKCDKKEAIEYLELLAKLPFFCCKSPPDEILKSGAKVFTDIPYENILAILSSIRYIHEYPGIVTATLYLNQVVGLKEHVAFVGGHFLRLTTDKKLALSQNLGSNHHTISPTYALYENFIPTYNAAFEKHIKENTPYNKLKSSDKIVLGQMWSISAKLTTHKYKNFSYFDLFKKKDPVSYILEYLKECNK